MQRDSKEKQTVLGWIDANRERLSDFHQDIWNYAETAYREYKSARAYCDLLRAEGFDVEEGSGDMPTAFMASWGEGRPVLASYAEYDAVPANSQQQVPYRAPREGLHPWAAGHTDPHSALGVATLSGLLAAKAVMQARGLKGTLRYFGEPAEKVCGSKPVHAAKGYYDDLDAAFSYHPFPTTTTIWDTHCGSYWSAVFTFECPEPEKWIDQALLAFPGHPHSAARCPGAIDALCLMYTNTKYTKEAMFPHTGTWTLNEFVMAGGQATSDNLPPRFSQIQYSWRSPSLNIQEQIYRVLANNARHAAQVTSCSVYVRWVTKTRVGLPNHALADLTADNLEMVGPPEYGEEARRFARAVQDNLGLAPMDDPFTEDCQSYIPPRDFEARRRQGLAPWQKNFTSDDYVDYTWHTPTVRLHTGRPYLKPPDSSFQYPAWVHNVMGGIRECIDPATFVAGKAIAATMIDLLTRPEELENARAEFEERTGGGIGGTKWIAPLLPKDFPTPVDLRWPEYVETPRGREWWAPTPGPAGFGERLS